MFKWPGTPSPRPGVHEIADFAELSAWQKDPASSTAIAQAMGRFGETSYSHELSGEESDGNDEELPEEEESIHLTEQAYLEIERRREACGDGYPFILDQQGYTIRLLRDSLNERYAVYKYLLLATRLNMKDNRQYAGIDGTHLLEELAAEVAREYLGDRAESLVFGTASEGGSFSDRVDHLCQRIGEGDGFMNRGTIGPQERDGKLDVVAWKNFTDRQAGKLITFGQCKTGTDYKDTLTQLQPDSFCKKWMRSQPVVNPVRMFFISESLPDDHWYNISSDAGILFDRCRIIDFCDSVSPDVLGRIKDWTEAAAKDNDLPAP